MCIAVSLCKLYVIQLVSYPDLFNGWVRDYTSRDVISDTTDLQQCTNITHKLRIRRGQLGLRGIRKRERFTELMRAWVTSLISSLRILLPKGVDEMVDRVVINY